MDARPPGAPGDDTAEHPVVGRHRRPQWATIALAVAVMALLGGALALLWPRAQQSGPEPSLAARPPEAAAPVAVAAGPEPIAVSATPQRPLRTPALLPAEAPRLYCFFDAALVGEGEAAVTWTLDGADLGPLPRPELATGPDGQPVGRVTLERPGGAAFAPGIYQLRISSGGRLVAEASFVLARGAAEILARKAPPAAETAVTELRTVTGVGADGWPLGLTEQFRPADDLWVWFSFANGIPGGAFEVRWLCRGVLIPQATTQVPMRAESGWGNARLKATGGTALPAGRYEAQVLLAGGQQALARVEFTVLEPGREPATGPAPPRPAAPAPAASGAAPGPGEGQSPQGSVKGIATGAANSPAPPVAGPPGRANRPALPRDRRPTGR